jgi:hypothetical protein
VRCARVLEVKWVCSAGRKLVVAFPHHFADSCFLRLISLRLRQTLPNNGYEQNHAYCNEERK